MAEVLQGPCGTCQNERNEVFPNTLEDASAVLGNTGDDRTAGANETLSVLAETAQNGDVFSGNESYGDWSPTPISASVSFENGPGKCTRHVHRQQHEAALRQHRQRELRLNRSE